MSGIDVNLLFIYLGSDNINKKKMKKLSVATLSNPVFNPWLYIPTIIGVLPGISAAASWMIRQEIDKLDFPPVDEFIEMVIDSGAKVHGCKMSMDMIKLTAEDLVDGVDVLGVMEMLELADGAQVLFV